jgi:hypothetical protein
MNCLDENIKLVSISCPIKEVFFVFQIMLLIIGGLIRLIKYTCSTLKALNDLKAMSACDEYREFVVKTKRGVSILLVKLEN